MPLVIIAGYPCSGKSSVATAVEKAVRDGGGEAYVLSENDLFSDRNKCYTSAVTPCPAKVSLATMMRGKRIIMSACLNHSLRIDDFRSCSACGGEKHPSANTLRGGQASNKVYDSNSRRPKLR